MTSISIKSVLAAVTVAVMTGPAFAAAAVSGSGSLTVNPTPVAAPPAPLAVPATPSVRAASADPLAGALSSGVSSPLTTGPGTACCPCRPVHRAVHRRIVRRAARPPVAVVEVVPPPPLVPYYPVLAYRPVYVARPVFVYRPPVVVYGRPAPFLIRPFFYGPRPFWRSYYRRGW